VNEISVITESVGPSCVDPTYNRAGNMTTMPKPADPTDSFTATYDAWNRLVKLEDGSGTVAQYEYDGAKRRTVKKTYSGDVLGETRHMLYTEPSRWQVVEERVGTSTDADRQFVWGLRYLDDIVERDRDTDDDGALDERLYGMQDANWSLTGLFDDTGAGAERYSYHPYGAAQVLTPAFLYHVNSSFSWNVTYAGYSQDIGSLLLLARHRYLHCHLGLWTQRDPLTLSAGVSLYEYVGSTPLNATDPTGLLVHVTVLVIVGGVVVATLVLVLLVVSVILIDQAVQAVLKPLLGTETCVDVQVEIDVRTEDKPQGKTCAELGMPRCPEDAFHSSKNKQAACRRCNGPSSTNGKTKDVDKFGDPLESEGFVDPTHTTCKGKEGQPQDAVICGSCCVEPKRGDAFVDYRCKCAPHNYDND
jgi:RHS repeat-associated protein